MMIEARRVVRFKPSDRLKKQMNPHKEKKRVEEPVREVQRLDAPMRQQAALKGGRFA